MLTEQKFSREAPARLAVQETSRSRSLLQSELSIHGSPELLLLLQSFFTSYSDFNTKRSVRLPANRQEVCRRLNAGCEQEAPSVCLSGAERK